MPTLDPRYRYPAGWWAGNTALGLADLLGQGFDRLHQQNQDELGQQNKQQDYLLKLQQFLSGEQDRGLDRNIKQQTADLQGQQIQDLIAQRKTKAEDAVNQRSAIVKLIAGLNQDVPTQEAAPQPPPQALAVSPQAEDRTLGQFIYGKRKATPQEALAGLGEDAANVPKDYLAELAKIYQPKEPKAPKFGFGAGLGTYDEGTGQVATPVPDKPEKPAPNPTETTVLLDAARDRLAKQGVADPSPGQLGTMAETIRLERAKAGATTVNLSAGERDKNAEQENTATLGREIRDLYNKTPGLVGGAFGSTSRWNALKFKFGNAPKEYATLDTKTKILRATLIHELTGANIGPQDQGVYMDMMPNAEKDNEQQFEAHLDATLGNIERLRGIRARIQGTPKGQPTINTESPRGGQMPPLDFGAIDAELKRRGVP